MPNRNLPRNHAIHRVSSVSTQRRYGMNRMTLSAGIALMAVLAGCGGAGGGTSPDSTASGNTVSLLDNNSFSPSTLTVTAGTTVTWKWPQCTDGGYSTCASHSVTFDDGSNVASSTQSQGQFTRTFAMPGTYKYHCSIHGTGMSG